MLRLLNPAAGQPAWRVKGADLQWVQQPPVLDSTRVLLQILQDLRSPWACKPLASNRKRPGYTQLPSSGQANVQPATVARQHLQVKAAVVACPKPTQGST